jgi:hypothetical protein
VDFGISAQIDNTDKVNEPVGSYPELSLYIVAESLIFLPPYWMPPEVILETDYNEKAKHILLDFILTLFSVIYGHWE